MSFGNPTSANIVKSSTAVSQLISTPANNILVFTQKLAAPYDPSPRAESCSPLSLTNPPIGSQFTVNNTPFLSFFFHARGGNPMPNSSTTTPFRRATIACPSSCSTTSSTSTINPVKIPNNSISFYPPNRRCLLEYSSSIAVTSSFVISGHSLSKNKNSL